MSSAARRSGSFTTWSARASGRSSPSIRDRSSTTAPAWGSARASRWSGSRSELRRAGPEGGGAGEFLPVLAQPGLELAEVARVPADDLAGGVAPFGRDRGAVTALEPRHQLGRRGDVVEVAEGRLQLGQMAQITLHRFAVIERAEELGRVA